MQNEILKRNRGEDGTSKVHTDAIKVTRRLLRFAQQLTIPRQAQFDEMSRLGQVYRETALVSGPNAIQQKRALSLGEREPALIASRRHEMTSLPADKHRRQTHVRTLSCRAATIAMRETNNKLRNEKVCIHLSSELSAS